MATSDNDEGSNYSSYCVASRKKIKECSEKGSDAQVCIFFFLFCKFRIWCHITRKDDINL